MNRFIWIIVVLLLLLAVICGRYWLGGGDVGDVLAKWGHGESPMAESYYYDSQIKRIAGCWEEAADWSSQRRKDGKIKQPNDVFMVIDSKKPAMWVEYKGKVVDEFYTELPSWMKWEVYHLTADGSPLLPAIVRLQIRGVFTDRIFPETIYLAGIGKDRHMSYSISNRISGSSRGSGTQINIPQYRGRTPKKDVEAYKSVIVDEEEYAGYLAGLKDRRVEGDGDGVVELLFQGSDVLRANMKKWLAVEKRMYAEMARQLSRQGYEIRRTEVVTGPSYLAGHAELDGRDYGMFGGGSVDVNLNFEHLGEGLWHVYSMGGRLPGRRRDKLKLDFVVTENGEVDAEKAERLKAEMTKTARAENEKLGLSKWRAKLDNGVVIEFTGLCESPSGGKSWFGPDGSDLGYAPYPNYKRYGKKGDNRNYYEFAWRVYGTPNGGSTGSTYSMEGSLGSYSRSTYDKYGYNSAYKGQGLTVNGYSFKNGQEKATLKLGFKVGGKTDYSYVRFENISLVRGKDMGFKIVVGEEK